MFINIVDDINYTPNNQDHIYETQNSYQVHTVQRANIFWDEQDSEQWVVLDNGIGFLLKWYDGFLEAGQEVILIPKKGEDIFILIRKDNPQFVLELYRVEGKYYMAVDPK